MMPSQKGNIELSTQHGNVTTLMTWSLMVTFPLQVERMALEQQQRWRNGGCESSDLETKKEALGMIVEASCNLL